MQESRSRAGVAGKAKNFTRFLSCYLPGQATNVASFDEKVAEVANKYGVRMFEFGAPRADEIRTLLTTEDCVHILVAGVAGDGKTYNLRKVFTDLTQLEGDLLLDAWNNAQGDKQDPNPIVVEVFSRNGSFKREVQFIKDLTANKNYLKGIGEGDGIITELLNPSPEKSYVIACNHGQLLEQLRSINSSDSNKLADEIENHFFGQGEIEGSIKIFDLSQINQSLVFKSIVREVCSHEAWNDVEEAAVDNPQYSMMLKNRASMWKNEGLTKEVERFSELLKLLAMERVHFTIREMLMLVSNALLGNGLTKDKSKELGLKCIVGGVYPASGDDDSGSCIHQNLFGRNLTERERHKHRIFTELDRFQIGTASTRGIDSELLNLGFKSDSKEIAEVEEFISRDPACAKFKEMMRDKLEKQGEDEQYARTRADILSGLEALRRRLFLTMPELPNSKSASKWCLTSFKNAASYLQFVGDKRTSKRLNSEKNLRRGLAMFMSGAASDSDEFLYITTRGAEVDERGGTYQAAKYQINGITLEKLFSSMNDDSVLPSVVLKFPINGSKVEFLLTPSSYECLMLLGEGFSIASFSREKIAELTSLKQRLIAEYKKTRTMDDCDEGELIIKLVRNSEIVLISE